jgi:hypothetical protein
MNLYVPDMPRNMLRGIIVPGKKKEEKREITVEENRRK